MQQYEVDYLDIVIIRSCQMSCAGCCTFSDHTEINGLVEPSDYKESIAFWSQIIKPKRLHLFGGEPTMHPRLIEWVRLLKKYWPKMPIWLNTNGYFLDRLFDHVDELYNWDDPLFVSVTHHTATEPYSSLVKNNYKNLMDLIYDRYQRVYPQKQFTWELADAWSSEHKKFYDLTDQRGNTGYALLNMCFQNDDFFVPHYKGYGQDLKPWHQYTDNAAKYDNHRDCHIKNYVQLYEGKLYKCPPRAVLNQTLETYNIQDSDDWRLYYNDYKPLLTTATASEIDEWFAQQKLPENTCNMCGFNYSTTYLPTQEHLPKKLFKIKAI